MGIGCSSQLPVFAVVLISPPTPQGHPHDPGAVRLPWQTPSLLVFLQPGHRANAFLPMVPPATPSPANIY